MGDNVQDPSEQHNGKIAPPLNCSSLASPCLLSFAFSLHFFSLLPSASYLLRLSPPAHQLIRSRSSLFSFSLSIFLILPVCCSFPFSSPFSFILIYLTNLQQTITLTTLLRTWRKYKGESALLLSALKELMDFYGREMNTWLQCSLCICVPSIYIHIYIHIYVMCI